MRIHTQKTGHVRARAKAAHMARLRQSYVVHAHNILYIHIRIHTQKMAHVRARAKAAHMARLRQRYVVMHVDKSARAVCMYIRMYVYMYMYIYSYIHTHTHTYIRSGRTHHRSDAEDDTEMTPARAARQAWLRKEENRAEEVRRAQEARRTDSEGS
jgi:hypothetical protein